MGDEFGVSGFGGVGSPIGDSDPSVSIQSPAYGSEVPATTSFIFDVTSPNFTTGFNVIISATFVDSPAWELVYNGAFSPLYNGGGTSMTVLGSGYRFSIRRGAQWPSGAVVLKVFAVDAYGNRLDVDLTWTVVASVVALSTGIPTTQPAPKIDRYGTGIKLPFARNSSGLDFQSETGQALVRQAVWQVLSTVPGELPWRPNFGTLLNALKHLRNTQALPELARISIEQALTRWEPRIRVLSVVAEQVDYAAKNTVSLALIYSINDTSEALRISF